MPQVKTETSELEPSNVTDEARFYARRVGEALAPAGSQYIGSFNLHIYKGRFSLDGETYYFATQFIGEVPEKLAIEAAKELKTRMLSKYGHDKKERK